MFSSRRFDFFRRIEAPFDLVAVQEVDRFYGETDIGGCSHMLASHSGAIEKMRKKQVVDELLYGL